MATTNRSDTIAAEFAEFFPPPIEAADMPAETKIVDYIAPGPGRVIPTPTRDQALTQGGVRSPGKAWISCPGCGHPAWRDAPGVDAWTCGCPIGPRGACHGPRLVADAAGVGQITFGPYVIRPFPGLPPDAA